MTKEVTELRDLNLDLESLKARKAAIKQRLVEHRDAVKQGLVEHRDILTNDDIKKLDEETRSVVTSIQTKEARVQELQKIVNEQQKNKEERKINMDNNIEKRSSMEYRKAFMEYVARGVQSDILEIRQDAATTTTTAATVIPTTVMNEIIKLSKVSGNILSKVRKLNIKGGLQIPTLSVNPEATWIDEDTPSDRKSVSTGKITFSYFGLEVKIAQTLLSAYTSVDAFESEFANLAVEAMTNAKEIAIFNGTGSGQPKGIFKETGVNDVTINVADLTKYDVLVKSLGKLPTSYRAGADLVMAQGTWDAICGMVDNNGQPVARVNYGFGKTERSFLGYNVEIVEEDRIKSVVTATASSDYIMCLGNFNNYAINGNGDLGVYKYRDEDKNQDVTKALEFLDGKPLQPKAFLRVKKGTDAAAAKV